MSCAFMPKMAANCGIKSSTERWLTVTPLGTPVLPLVKLMYSGSTSTACARRAASSEGCTRCCEQILQQVNAAGTAERRGGVRMVAVSDEQARLQGVQHLLCAGGRLAGVQHGIAAARIDSAEHCGENRRGFFQIERDRAARRGMTRPESCPARRAFSASCAQV